MLKSCDKESRSKWEMVTNMLTVGEHNSSGSRVFITNHEGQKEVAAHFSVVERGELSNENSILRKISFRKIGNYDILK
jgi:hypothetical protein